MYSHYLLTKRLALFLCSFILIVLTACQPSAQEMLQIGIVNPVEIRDPLIDDFIKTMATLGYIEGETVRYLYEGAISDADERMAWARSLVEREVDLIFAVTTPGAQTAVAVTDTIPIVFAPITDPIGAGLVDDLNAPGGNVTGITNGNPHPLRFRLMLDIDPSIEIVYAPHNPRSSPARTAQESIVTVAADNQITLQTPIVVTLAEIEAAMYAIPDDADAIFILPDPAIANYTSALVPLVIERGIPLVSLSHSEVEAGALMAYGERLEAVAAQAARMVDRVLQGTPPGDLPVETAEFFLSINLATAERINLTIPDEILNRANYLIRSLPEG